MNGQVDQEIQEQEDKLSSSRADDASKQQVDLNALTEAVMRLFRSELRIERERWGTER